MFKEVVRFLKKIKEISRNPVMKILPGQLAFFFVLSLPPLLSLVGIMGNIFISSSNKVVEFIKESFPPSTSEIIIPIITSDLKTSAIVFIIGALIMVSKGLEKVIITSNVLYNNEYNNTINRFIKSLFMTLMLIILFAFTIIVPTLGDNIIQFLRELNYFNGFYDNFIIIYHFLKFPISFMLIFVIVKLIYTIAPDHNIKSRDVNFGAIFTSIGWIIATKVYSIYLSNFASYDVFYGNIANLIALLFWMYILSHIFVLGMALNVSAYSLVLKDNKKE